jgi:hypothetical protein
MAVENLGKLTKGQTTALERRLDSANKRHLRAIKALADTRRLLPKAIELRIRRYDEHQAEGLLDAKGSLETEKSMECGEDRSTEPDRSIVLVEETAAVEEQDQPASTSGLDEDGCFLLSEADPER